MFNKEFPKTENARFKIESDRSSQGGTVGLDDVMGRVAILESMTNDLGARMDRLETRLKELEKDGR